MASSVPLSVDLKRALLHARANGTLDQLVARLADDTVDSEFELISDVGAMSDASKRRMTEPPESELTLSGSDLKEHFDASPADLKGLLPRGIVDLDHWGKTVLNSGKYAKDGMSYVEIYTSSKKEHQSYCQWMMGQRGRHDLTPPVKDFVRFLVAKDNAKLVPADCFEGSATRRQLKG